MSVDKLTVVERAVLDEACLGYADALRLANEPDNRDERMPALPKPEYLDLFAGCLHDLVDVAVSLPQPKLVQLPDELSWVAVARRGLRPYGLESTLLFQERDLDTQQALFREVTERHAVTVDVFREDGVVT